MKREYLVVYEKAATNWSAFVPDLPGCGSLGDTIEDTRANVSDAMRVYLAETAKAGEQIPEAKTTAVNIDEFDPLHETKQYCLEWLSVPIPEPATLTTDAHQAA